MSLRVPCLALLVARQTSPRGGAPSTPEWHGSVEVPPELNLEDGVYRLILSDGRDWRVMKLGRIWSLSGTTPGIT
jgi:hypothetical protein